MKVVDASVAVKWFSQEPERAAAMQLIRSGEVLVAPDLIVMEVLNVLRRKQRMQTIEERQVVDAAATIVDCFGELAASASLAREATRLSIALDHSVYDCAYLAYSMALDVDLITADRVFVDKVRASISGARVSILLSLEQP